MRPQLLLQLLTARPRNARARGYTMVAGILVVASLLVGTLGMLALVNGTKLGALFSSEYRDAQSVADSGASRIINTFNQPQNRQLLVAGSTPPSQWSTSNQDLQSPCLSSTGGRPGTNGMPTQQAVNFADGQFRDLETLEATSQAQRRFKLLSVRYSAGEGGSSNRRSIYRTFLANGNTLSQAGAIPAGSSFNSLVNLDYPDGGDALNPGGNTGLIALTVEGRLYRADGSFTTSTITKEFEVVPKCCGGSFGGNGSGGSADDSPAASLGADRRSCGLDFGLIVGLNNGRMFSNRANDRFTRTNQAGEVVSINSILGVVANPGHGWNRTASSLSGGSEVGCRTMPSTCNTSADDHPLGNHLGGNNTLTNLFKTIIASTAGNGTPRNCPQIDVFNNPAHPYGNRASVAGRAASCVPIMPLHLQSPGLPSIQSSYTYSWTPQANLALNPLARYPYDVTQRAINSSNNASISNGYPIIKAAEEDGFDVWIRANDSFCQLVDIPHYGCGWYIGAQPVLEYCNTKYLPNNRCASIYDPENPSQIHTWAAISLPAYVSWGYGISDNFTSYGWENSLNESHLLRSIGGRSSGSIPRWPSLWTLSQENNMSFQYGAVKFLLPGGGGPASWGGSPNNTNTTAPAMARAVNLYALINPVLSIQFNRTTQGASNSSTNSVFRVDYSFTPDPNDPAKGVTTNQPVNTDEGWIPIATLHANGEIRKNGTIVSSCNEIIPFIPRPRILIWRCNILIPPQAYASTNPFRHFVKFRVRANSNFSNIPITGQDPIQEAALNAVAITSDLSGDNPTDSSVLIFDPGLAYYQNWCEYQSQGLSGRFHCLGPTIDLAGAANNLYIDTTHRPISFYYNSPNDTRGISMEQPLIKLSAGASIFHVACPRDGEIWTTPPKENCKTPVNESAFSPVGDYGRLNFFGRGTVPANTCNDSGLRDQPCNQVIVIDTNSYGGKRSSLYGAWLYFPWGHVAFCGITSTGRCSLSDSLTAPADDSLSFFGRLWVRSLSSGGQAHLRIAASPSTSLSSQVGAINWTGIDWVARAPTSRRYFGLF